MGGREGEADQLLAVEDRHAEADVRAVGGTVVGRVVDDHVALVELLAALGEELEDAPHIAGDRTQLERGGEGRLAKLASLRVEQGAAEVLRLSDDAGVGHPGQLVAHLDGDALESAGDNTGADRVKARVSGLPSAPVSGGGCHSAPSLSLSCSLSWPTAGCSRRPFETSSPAAPRWCCRPGI